MALKRIRRRRRASITSLIDVIFLLLLFFMLASTFSNFSEIEIVSGTPGSGATSQISTHHLTVGSSSLLLDQSEVSPANLASRLEELHKTNDRPSIAVEATPDATTQDLIDALTLIQGLPWLKVHVMEPA